MKTINDKAQNNITIAGKLLDATFTKGSKDGRPYERFNLTVRVSQKYLGVDETSEIPVSGIVSQFTKNGAPNPAYASLQQLKNFKTVQNCGFAEADSIKITRGSISENNFMSRSGNLINGWQIRTTYVNKSEAKDIASFLIDIFIMDMKEELDKDETPTGRLIIKGGIVQYDSSLSVLEFIVEDPQCVEYISSNWNINDTVYVKGRIRYTSTEVNSTTGSSWGEDVPDTSTRTVRELIITTGSDEPYDEDSAYDPVEIKKAFNIRKANIEQLQAQKVAPKQAKTTSGWDD